MNKARTVTAAVVALLGALTTACALLLSGGASAHAPAAVSPVSIPVRIVVTTTPGIQPDDWGCSEISCPVGLPVPPIDLGYLGHFGH